MMMAFWQSYSYMWMLKSPSQLRPARSALTALQGDSAAAWHCRNGRGGGQ